MHRYDVVDCRPQINRILAAPSVDDEARSVVDPAYVRGGASQST